MDWLHKLRRALLAFSARLKLRKSVGSVAGRVGGECDGIGGLLKLQDDVQMCGYQDVQIMWNMLSKAQQGEMMIMATTTTAQPPKPNKQHRQRHSWSLRTFFWSSHRAASWLD